MPEGSSSNTAEDTAERRVRAGASYAPRVRLAMIVIGFIPAIHILCVLAIVVFGGRWRWASPAVLFLVPPLAARGPFIWASMPAGRFRINSREFLLWWYTAQWQILFNRLPMLEESLRLLPGVYSMWLRLWGARVGAIVYWSPGVRVLDRPLLDVGDRVVFGAGVRINPHVLLPDESGGVLLAIGRVRIETDCLVGGYSLLLAGVRLIEGSVTPPLKSLPPFTTWNGRRRVRDDEPATPPGEVDE